MTSETLTEARGFTVERGWLTSELQARGYLDTGSVTGIEQAPLAFMPDGYTGTARLETVDVSYSDDAGPLPPENLLLKTNRPERFDMNAHEVAFYRLADEHSVPNVLPVFGTNIDTEQQSTALLMEDIGGDQIQTPYPVPHQVPVCERALRALAGIHAAWWDADELKNHDPLTLEKLDGQIAFFMPMWEAFQDEMGDNLSAERTRIIDRYLDALPALTRQHLAEMPLTLIHGDAHFWNYLVPPDETKPVYLIDWQMWDVTFAGNELAYGIALQWFPERRHRFEKHLLEVYREALAEAGVALSRDALMLDYRHGALRNLVVPVMQQQMGFSNDIMWAHLDRAFSAVHDLDCLELLP